MEYTCDIAQRALHSISNILKYTNIKLGLQLYIALVRSHLERTFPIWCSANQTVVNKVNPIQRSALLKVTNAFTSTSTAALELLTGLPPIPLRLEEILLNEFSRIKAKPTDDHLGKMVSDLACDDKFMDHKTLSPIHMHKLALADCPNSTRYVQQHRITIYTSSVLKSYN